MCLLFACSAEAPGQDLQSGQGLPDGDKGGDDSSDPLIIESRVCATGQTTLGIDVSYYDGTINWSSVLNAGYKFAFIRVSDGTGFHDPKFTTNWANAKAAGVVRGVYQFFRPAESVTAQADLLINAIGSYTAGDLPPVIDVEVSGGLSASGVASAVSTWVNRVKNALGVTPIVYTGPSFWRDSVGSPSSFASNPLWIAHYTSLCPDVPGPWSQWTFWQNTDTGHVSGISGDVDLDKFNGSYADLLAFTNGMVTMPPPGNCPSATMNASEPSGTCVQAASDSKWYQCENGAWNAITSTSGCTTTFAWCQSATLGKAVAPRTCVQAASDSQWYQCDGHGWVQPVDTAAQSGPAGMCSASFPH
jgi:GH25 family lysozyme M1 (1,4-beta-N-acetylmuramidase)